jgi:hypothetical protein
MNLAGARQRKCRAALARDAGKRNFDMQEIALRHHCRNRRCRSKLPTPTDIPQRAFCTRFCFDSFYRSRCVVCERDITTDPLTGQRRRLSTQRRYCGRKCAAQARQWPHRYHPSGHRRASKNSAAKSTLKSAVESNRARIVAPAHVLAVEVFDCAWQAAISSDGVPVEVSRLRFRALLHGVRR